MKHLIATLLLSLASAAQADATSTLREFVHDVKTGRAQFTQTVTSPDGVKKKTSSGSFEFSRPNRFKFNYTQPFQQLIVADGKKVWIFDADLNQASSRPFSSALGATPAALLAGTSLDTDFDLAEQPAQDGLTWVQAKPKQADSTFKSLRVGFKGKELAAIEILDAFGQRSLLQFSQFTPGVALADDVFRYTPPKGVDVMEQ